MLAKSRAALAILALSFTTPVFAEDVVLTVSGAVSISAEGGAWAFDMAALRALPAESFSTTTIWTDGARQFEGVSLAVLMDHVGAKSGEIRAVALNDYAVSIPMTDAVSGGPIIAYRRDGAPMSVRDKGPLWIIYPFDDNERYQSEEYYSRSIWQLDRIEIVAEK